MSRLLRYQVAVSLDGFITGPGGAYDWIVGDPAIDFAALYEQFDNAVMGRKTYEAGASQGADGTIPGMDVVVFSRTLRPVSRTGMRIVADDPREIVRELKTGKGKDIWLFGGGELFRTLLDAGLVDTVEVAVMPVLVSEGTPLLPPGAAAKLVLHDHRVLPGSGIVVLSYSVAGSKMPAPKIQFVKSPRRNAAKRASRKKQAAKAARKRGKR